jgi:chromosomal replication initiator protein
LTASDREVVAALGQAIARRIGEPRYNLWFDRHTQFRCEDGQLVVGVPNHFMQEWLQKTFGDAVQAAAGEVLARPMQVRFTIDPELFQAARREQDAAAGKGASGAHRVPSEETPGKEQSAQPIQPAGNAEPANPRARQAGAGGGTAPRPASRRWRRLAEFVVGPCNRVAHAAAVNVVESAGEGPNPLVLHGPVGTGKTHLLEGIFAGLRKQHPAWRVHLTTSEEFTNRFLQGLRLGKVAAFRKLYRECDALLVDDLHFLARKRASHEEFQHTFDALLTDGKLIVVTCDCHPRLADQYTPELTDRLLGGALWGLAPPDPQTREEMLRVKAAKQGLILPDELRGYLAGQLRGNVRELEGALHCVGHLSRVTGRPVDLALAREALADLLRHAVRVVQPADVDRAVCRVLRLDPGALQSRRRAWQASHPRMLAVYLARKHTAATFGEIGQFFGGRNHSTAVAAEKKVRGWIDEDAELTLGERPLRVREVIERVERELLG